MRNNLSFKEVVKKNFLFIFFMGLAYILILVNNFGLGLARPTVLGLILVTIPLYVVAILSIFSAIKFKGIIVYIMTLLFIIAIVSGLLDEAGVLDL